MKLSKTFLMGIPALALVFALTLVGCDNGSTDTGGGGDDGGGSSNSLTGSWVDDRTTPNVAFIFTDVADTAITGAKIAYWSTNLNDEGTGSPATGNDITINRTAYTYTLSGNTLTLDNYDAGATQSNVTFDRAKGTSGSTMHGIWISRLASTNQLYTLLIIRTGTARTFTSVGAGTGGEVAYSLSSNANTTYITWGNNNPTTYTKTADPTQLTITDPNGQQQPNLITQTSW
jgi:hypothetical protein